MFIEGHAINKPLISYDRGPGSFQGSVYTICGGKNDTGTGFAPGTYVLLATCHSTDVLYSSII